MTKSKNEKPAIIVNNVSKTFKLPHEKKTSVKGIFVDLFKGRSKFEEQCALENISFKVNQGEFFGIVGRNGSGKSTLLKLLAGIYSPSKGDITINGSLTPFIELGVGFSPELTGRENIYLNGALLGFDRQEMTAMYDEIVEFAELKRFMDQKLKNYSSGMQVRLAFSIAIRAKTSILLLDEVLAVGDARFQQKCYDYFYKLKREGRTVVLVTHDMSAIQKFCDRTLLIHESKVVGIYNPYEAAAKYDQVNFSKMSPQSNKDKGTSFRRGSKEVKLKSLVYKSKKISPESTIKASQGASFSFTAKLINPKNLPFVVGLAFYDQHGVNIAGPNSSKYTHDSTEVKFLVEKLSFNPGTYTMMFVVYDILQSKEYDYFQKALIIEIGDVGYQTHGKINMFESWTTE